MTKEEIERCIDLYDKNRFQLEQFMKRMVNFFQDNPVLHKSEFPAVHSVKYRLKDTHHLVEKFERKKELEITESNFFDKITDLAGIRILHLYSDQFIGIHEEIMNQVNSREIVLYETPVAYTWDIDMGEFFEKLNLNVKIKPSYYTSVHYVVMPKENSNIKCEIQVRTLFEEAWGEIDHSMNYPTPIGSIACREQLKALAQLTSAGIKLANSIVRSQKEYMSFANLTEKDK